jgi:hypothetical protein
LVGLLLLRRTCLAVAVEEMSRAHVSLDLLFTREVGLAFDALVMLRGGSKLKLGRLV